MIGNASVGKTALIMRYINKTYKATYDETVGAAFHTFQAKIDGQQITIQVWDTAGQEKYRSLGPVYYRNTSAAILVYDITDRQSFLDLNLWIDTFRTTVGEDPMIFIVGNKIDLDTIQVDPSEGQQFADEQGFPFFSTSAVSGFNVDFLFQSVAEQIVKADPCIHQQTQPKEKTESSQCC